MKIVLFLGYGRRYFKLAQKIQKEKYELAIVVQQVENPKLVQEINMDDYSQNNLEEYHFALRDYAEYKYFNDIDPEFILNQVTHYRCGISDLNSEETQRFVETQKPDIIISFGVTFLKDKMLQICPNNSYNFHNGLVPYYKGSANHFWATYFLEPTFVGCTFHKLSSRLDGGDVVHQCVAPMSKGDNMHDISCKATLKMIDDIVRILNIFEKQGYLESVPQKKNGRMYTNIDFREEHLRVIYELYDNKIVDRYLDGTLTCRKPEIITLFDD